VLRRGLLVVLAPLAVASGGCGDDGARSTTGARAQAAAVPALARPAPATGELLFSGQSSPREHGPFELDGRYLVRFEQLAPEDPSLDFAGQTPFTASLLRRAGDERGAVRLFGAARRSGRRTLALHGRYVLDVSFGDFPYAVRFTPRR
jgi:hypothetical protein